ncbi:uncharacterized protein MELLADRAFT_102976 [Melampsora larici-populina 98AG31]|uniref:Zn(2)-C6 fungal-type domain-containing protein n=1 Tax=Melampsora larici-populina (strain 98AG31 / pathotype 3-4-7) TaxID=747676 RepID=F4RA52_MELLP|nr:uncharacterized protein MELLADRAFT_102976 [Melampsora larici-populina 98AG31]EGG10420.1 hypothetical protein MELLADRAFT_102976 [Melampsora larici-populina 98AG31]
MSYNNSYNHPYDPHYQYWENFDPNSDPAAAHSAQPPYPTPYPYYSSNPNFVPMPLASTSSQPVVPPPTSETTSKSKAGKRRKVAKACLFCKRSHMTCDDSRPCQRCIKREIGHLCCDEPPSSTATGSAVERNPPQSSLRNIITNPSNRLSELSSMENSMNNSNQHRVQLTNRLDIDPSITTPHHLQPYQNLSSTGTGSSGQISGSRGITEPSSRQPPLIPTGGSSNSLLSVMNLRNPNPPEQSLSPKLDFNDILMSYPGLFSDQIGSMSDTITPANHRNEVRSRNPIESGRNSSRFKDLTLFDYQQGHHKLLDWIHRIPSADTKSKLLRTIGDFQPHLLAITSSLSTSDQIESEICFYRLLQEYTPIFSTLPIPACVWRRTGEIVKTNQQFCQLIGYHRSSFETEPKCIYELWNDESNLNYWEKYSGIALDESQKAVLTSCVLLQNPQPSSPSDHSPLPCTFSFTIRRDQWAVPSLIVGNFLLVTSLITTFFDILEQAIEMCVFS